MSTLIPPKLQNNSTLGIVSPSGSCHAKRLQAALDYLRNKGFHICQGQSVYAQNRYLAGTDEQRAQDINTMFANPAIHAIFASRGGYGSARILDLLDWDLIRNNPKPLIGLSDTTALQLGLLSQTNMVSYSGLALCSDITHKGLDADTEKALWQALQDHTFEPIQGLVPIRPGDISGTLIGGCLSLFASLAGTAYLPNCKDALIFLEDVNEPPYRVDRLLNQLRMTGVFEQASGVLFGQFVGSEPDTPKEGTLQDVLEDFAEQVTCPVYANLPYGHGKKRRVMPIGWHGNIIAGQLSIADMSV